MKFDTRAIVRLSLILCLVLTGCSTSAVAAANSLEPKLFYNWHPPGVMKLTLTWNRHLNVKPLAHAIITVKTRKRGSGESDAIDPEDCDVTSFTITDLALPVGSRILQSFHTGVDVRSFTVTVVDPNSQVQVAHDAAVTLSVPQQP